MFLMKDFAGLLNVPIIIFVDMNVEVKKNVIYRSRPFVNYDCNIMFSSNGNIASCLDIYNEISSKKM